SPEITPTGKRFWRYRYRISGKENIFAAGEWCQAPIGETPEEGKARQESGCLTLAEARVARLTWRAQVKAGQHPRLVRVAKRLIAAQSAAITFEAVTQEFIVRKGRGWSESYRRHFNSFMKHDVFPAIGALPIATLAAAHIRAVLEKVADRGAHAQVQAGRSYIGQVFRCAVSVEKAATDPTPLLRGAFDSVEVNHYPILTKATMGPFLRAVVKARPDRKTEIALRLLLLTMLRTVELRGGWWHEIDEHHAEWRIEAARMKM